MQGTEMTRGAEPITKKVVGFLAYRTSCTRARLRRLFYCAQNGPGCPDILVPALLSPRPVLQRVAESNQLQAWVKGTMVYLLQAVSSRGAVALPKTAALTQVLVLPTSGYAGGPKEYEKKTYVERANIAWPVAAVAPVSPRYALGKRRILYSRILNAINQKRRHKINSKKTSRLQEERIAKFVAGKKNQTSNSSQKRLLIVDNASVKCKCSMDLGTDYCY